MTKKIKAAWKLFLFYFCHPLMSLLLRRAMLRRLPRRMSASGKIVWPAVPSLLNDYTLKLGSIFAAVGREFTITELREVRKILKKHIREGFAQSPYSEVVIDYHTEPPPNTALSYTISNRVVSIDDRYADWVKTRKPPLFGAHADAKVMQLAKSLGTPSEVTVLDVGAGTGRNTLPLARAGFATDAVEIAPSLASILREEVTKAGVTVRVFEGDALTSDLALPSRHYRLAVLAEVVASHFRSTAQLRALFERSCEWLAPQGLLLFSAFLASRGYRPTPLARELSEVMWCCLFTRQDLKVAADGLPLTLVSDESTHDFEYAHLPESEWPPTGWFAEWSKGQDLYNIAEDKSPLELRWLVYRRD
jgi:SAM-dependent methyltransferase